MSQSSLKITMHYQKTLFSCIPKYFYNQNSTFQENTKTKVYAVEDSLGVVLSSQVIGISHIQSAIIAPSHTLKNSFNSKSGRCTS